MAQAHARSPSRGSEATQARIGSAARVRGRIHGEGDLIVEGHVEGDVAIRGDLTIAQGASVKSETVEAHAVTIAGTLDGDVAATGAVRLSPGARVRGNLQGSAVAIDDGARFSGKLDCEFDLPAELGGGARSERSERNEARARAPARR